MDKAHAPTDGYHEAQQYEIRLKGHLDTRWAEWFEGMSFACGSNGITILTGVIADQAALYSVLRKVRNLGLPLLSVIQITPETAEMSDVQP